MFGSIQKLVYTLKFVIKVILYFALQTQKVLLNFYWSTTVLYYISSEVYYIILTILFFLRLSCVMGLFLSLQRDALKKVNFGQSNWYQIIVT